MKQIKNSLVIAFAMLLAIGMIGRTIQATRAAEMKTAIAISFADVNTFFKAANDIAAKTGYPNAMDPLVMFVQSVDVLDKTKPKGIVIQSDGATFEGYAFVPISDVTAIPFIQFFDMEELGDGKYIVTLPNGIPLHIVQKEKWMFLSLGMAPPENLPADPSALLEGLNKKYVVGAKINVAALPKDLCINFLDLIRAMSGDMEDPSQENLNNVLDQVEKALDQINTIRGGVIVDPSTTDVTLEGFIDVLPKTEYAELFASMSKMTTKSMGFFQMKDSILAYINAGEYTEAQKTQAHDNLENYFSLFSEGVKEQGLGEDEEALIGDLLSNLESVLISSVDSGKFDGAVTLKNSGTALAVSKIAEGAKVADSLKQLTEAAPENYQKCIKLNEQTYEGYNLSSFVLPLKEAGCPEMPQTLMDKTLTVYVGVKDDSCCLAAGIDSNVLADLKKAIDGSQKETALPTTIGILAPNGIAKLVKMTGVLELPEISDTMKQLVDELEKCPADANIVVTEVYTPTTAESKIMISSKLFPAIGKLIQLGLENRPVPGDMEFDESDVEVEEIE